MLTIGIVGVGDWGKNYIKTIEDKFPNIILQQGNRDNWKDLLNNNPVGIIISTPPSSHVEIAKYFLQHNIPVMIEKPLSLSLEEAKQLSKFKSPILVNHIHLFAPAYQILKENIESRNIKSMESSGMNNGPFRDWCPLFDYGSHDVAICLDLVGEYPIEIKARQIRQGQGKRFIIELQFSNCNAIIKVDNVALYKYKCTEVKLTDNKYTKLIYEDNKLTGLRKDYLHRILVSKMTPLENAIKVFIDAINGKIDSRVGLELSFDVLKVLEECKKLLC